MHCVQYIFTFHIKVKFYNKNTMPKELDITGDLTIAYQIGKVC